ncbi:hypothetical protein DUNSADRAFT_10413 [Dunaliella salina]|uniref:PsbP C-terminal domain-containing protein n=1 Tax=Dunaliella salina TaxID=3046 RepID=A0ABQ7GFE9_DUNSA|nr:hypothetical protein DUNSADRAFT_10413 [Dunaliella salina]|eukprot:KAF5833333.1 hypothetical protein DUNSADRAFT_10413 [Dunaliella salina]
MMVPVGWEKKGKAGADVLFEDPARRSTSIGVTVNPVRVPRIEEFGSLEVIGQRLLDTERKKESTMGVTMVSQQQRAGLHGSDNNGSNKSGATLYDYEYDLNSTRGRKRILNTVTIYNSKLFILNGNLKCDKVEGQEDGGSADAPCIAPPGSLDALRAAARSFDVLPAT